MASVPSLLRGGRCWVCRLLVPKRIYLQCPRHGHLTYSQLLGIPSFQTNGIVNVDPGFMQALIIGIGIILETSFRNLTWTGVYQSWGRSTLDEKATKRPHQTSRIVGISQERLSTYLPSFINWKIWRDLGDGRSKIKFVLVLFLEFLKRNLDGLVRFGMTCLIGGFIFYFPSSKWDDDRK